MARPWEKRSKTRWVSPALGSVLSVSLGFGSFGCAASAPVVGAQAETPLAPAASLPASSSTPEAESSKSSTESEPADPALPRAFGWLSLAIGGESAIVATATGIIMLEAKSSRDSGCNAQKVCSSVGFNANNQIDSTEVWNAGAFVLAAAGLGIGTYLLLSHPIAEHARVSVSPTGVTLGGTF
jgi:hypothetical protein